MKRARIAVVILIAGMFSAASTQAEVQYWVSYTNEIAGPSGHANSVSGSSLSDNNHVEVDIENDGVVDNTYDLMASEGMSFTPLPGSKIVADYPLQLIYTYRFSDYGTYEDGGLRYELLPQQSIGDDYYAPIDASQAAVLSINDGCVIYYDANNDGTADDAFNLDEGDNHVFAAAAGGHLWSANDFYFVEAEWGASGYHHTYAFAVAPTHSYDTFYVSPNQHGYTHPSATDNSGVYVVSGADGVTVNIGAGQQILNAGDVWAFNTATEQIVSADGPILAVYLSSISGTDPWGGTWREWEFAIPLAPESFGVRELYTRGGAIDSHGGPTHQAFFASYSDGNQLDFECLGGGGTYNVTLNAGETLYLRETDTPLACWRSETTHLQSSAPVEAGISFRGWWNSYSESTDAFAYMIHVCECTENAQCDDGLYCNGEETCEGQCVCVDGDPPCPDDGLFCTGEESCDENLQECHATGDPCADNGVFCDGVESCDEESDLCASSGDPCADNGVFCDGVESCDEESDLCASSGDPCPDDGLFCTGTESCNEESDLCETTGEPCADDGLFCNGAESCDEENDECAQSGDPCADNGLFCDGETYCDAAEQKCTETGYPCAEDETCDEENDLCLSGDSPVAQDDEEAGWPEGKVTGGCCG